MDVPFRDKWHDFFCGKWHRSHATSAPDARTVPNGDEDLVPVIKEDYITRSDVHSGVMPCDDFG
jgi:hypothetical protein